MPSLGDGKKLRFFVRSKELRVQRFARCLPRGAKLSTSELSTRHTSGAASRSNAPAPSIHLSARP